MGTKAKSVEEILERMRRAYGVSTSSELSELANIPKSTISNWLARGNIPFRYLYECSNSTGVDVDWLLKGELAKANYVNREASVPLVTESAYDEILSAGGKAVLQRIMQAYGFSMQKQLGELMRISSGTMSTWIRRDYFPGDVVVACALDTGANLEWLATGRGEMISKSKQTESEGEFIKIPRHQLITGHIKDDGFWLCDKTFIPDDIVKPAYIEGSKISWLVEMKEGSFSNGLWFVDVDGAVDVCDITRLPGNRLKVISQSTQFECEATEILGIGRVFKKMEQV